MVDAFVDSAIVFDLHRGYAPSINWIQQNRHLSLAITPYVWMEGISGALNRLDEKRIAALMHSFQLVYLQDADVHWAMTQLGQFRLSHGVGSYDCLIASPSYRLQIPLLTRNMKHFRPLLGELAVQPYL